MKNINMRDLREIISDNVFIPFSRRRRNLRKTWNEDGGCWDEYLFEHSINKLVSIYDNKGITLDRYTIIFNDTKTRSIFSNLQYTYNCISASENGLGVYMWSEAMKGRHLGVKILFKDLAEDLKSIIIHDLQDYNVNYNNLYNRSLNRV